MAVEIRELVIKTTVDNSSAGSGVASSGGDEASGDLVAECVAQVMELIKQQKQR